VTWRRASCAAALLLAGCAAAPDRQADIATLAERVDSLMAPLVEVHEFSGAVVLTRRGRVVYARGFGMANRAAGVAFTPDTPSDGASLAKTFTAAGLWALVHEGRLDIDAPVRRHLPDYPHAATTVRQLLAHTHALPANYEVFDVHFAPDAVRTTDAMLATVARIAPRPAFAPGSRFEYSSLGYDAAARVIERVSGRRYEDFLAERFWHPLGLRSSFARPGRFADWPGVRTLGYRWKDGAWATFDVFDNEAFHGGSNLYFSAADLNRWASAFAAGRALPTAALATGQQRGDAGGRPTGITLLSWYCADASATRCHYSGDLNAFYSIVYWDRVRDETVVYVSNSTLPGWRRAGLARALIDALAGRAPEASALAAPAGVERVPAERSAQLAGDYRVDGIGMINVAPRASPPGFELRLGDGPVYAAFRVGADLHYVPGLDWWVGFGGGLPAQRLFLRTVHRDAIGVRQ
jgi:CubicO group peptidase (beta-lactamase class C family)